MTTDTSLAIDRDSNAISGGGSNANSGGRSKGSDTQQAIDQDSNANSGGESSAVDTQQAVGRDSNGNSGGQSATTASAPAALEESDPLARRATRRPVVYNERYTRDAIVRQDKRYGEAVARIAALDRQQRVIHLQSPTESDPSPIASG
jgi:hypothetical protein